MKPRLNAILLAIVVVFFVPLAALAGSCSFGAKDETPPFEYTAPQNCTVCQVVIKAGLNRNVTFTQDGDDGCYAVTGIGTQTAVAIRSGEEKPPCYDISHVDFHADCNTTAVTIANVDDNVDKTIIEIAVVVIIIFVVGLVVWSVAYERGYSTGWNTARDARKPFVLDIHRDEAP